MYFLNSLLSHSLDSLFDYGLFTDEHPFLRQAHSQFLKIFLKQLSFIATPMRKPQARWTSWQWTGGMASSSLTFIPVLTDFVATPLRASQTPCLRCQRTGGLKYLGPSEFHIPSKNFPFVDESSVQSVLKNCQWTLSHLRRHPLVHVRRQPLVHLLVHP